MCQFCVQHGDGKAWYLRAENYVADLESDLERRGYMIDFVHGYDLMRSRANVATRLLDRAPRPIHRMVARRVTDHQKTYHFGQPVPIEECERVFDLATSIVRLPCVCRTAARTRDDGVCLAVTVSPIDSTLAEAFKDYASGPDAPQMERLTKDQAMLLLQDCENDGLMHSVWTFMTPMIGAICNCDISSGCMAMDMTLNHGLKVMWRGEYVIELAEETCTGCGVCSALCPFDAIDFDRPARRVSVRQEDCYGCGVCRAKCQPTALKLVPRSTVPAVANQW